MAIVIFDLDGTVIDTSHRYRDLPCGKIDLDFWFANSTPEMIAQDKLLPLAATWRAAYGAGHTVVVCTARDFDPLNGLDLGAVYRDYLAANELHYHALLYRNLAGDDHKALSDGDLKIRLLGDYARANGFRSIADMQAVMFDDNLHVIEALQRERVAMINAAKENRRIEAHRVMGSIAA